MLSLVWSEMDFFKVLNQCIERHQVRQRKIHLLHSILIHHKWRFQLKKSWDYLWSFLKSIKHSFWYNKWINNSCTGLHFSKSDMSVLPTLPSPTDVTVPLLPPPHPISIFTSSSLSLPSAFERPYTEICYDMGEYFDPFEKEHLQNYSTINHSK